MIAEKLRLIGKIAKLHGFEGEALIIFEEAYLKKITKTEWLFLIIDGLPVPFFVSKIDQRSDTSIIVKFADIDSAKAMQPFIGCEIAITDKGQKVSKGKYSYSDISGYRTIDENRIEIGIVRNVINYNENYVLQIFKGDKEILIPVAEEIIISIDDKKKLIILKIPEGLLELYD
jgi:16S rRNA processing protein RimM